jgi:hypothetical protein
MIPKSPIGFGCCLSHFNRALTGALYISCVCEGLELHVPIRLKFSLLCLLRLTRPLFFT